MMIIILSSFLFAQESFESYNEKENVNIQKFNLNFEMDYKKYLEEEKEAYARFVKKIETIWGKEDIKLSTKTTWVDYNRTKTERSVVDFENNRACIEIIVNKQEADNKSLIQKKLICQIDELSKNKGKTRDYDIQNEKQKTISVDPLLKGQLVLKNGKTVSPKNSKEFAQETVKYNAIKKEKISKDKTKISIIFPLAPSSLRTRAAMFAPAVQQYSRIYGLKPELVMAIIHTESCFNPKAQSHIPAYGLMQLVPSSGGLDASRFVYKQNILLTSNVLFDPKKNIELGCAYLHLLDKRYLKDIINQESREYCVVSAYNTGVGNISKVFTGESTISKAAIIINNMSPDEVYSDLSQKLPYQETRDYLERVISRIKYYK